MIWIGDLYHILMRFAAAPAVLSLVLGAKPINLVTTLHTFLVGVSFVKKISTLTIFHELHDAMEAIETKNQTDN